MKFSGKGIGLVVLAGTAIVLAIGAPYSGWYRDRTFRTLPLKELLRDQQNHQNDPIYLYYLGRRLNEQGQFTTSLDVLERATGLDPYDVRFRDAWAQSLLATGKISAALAELNQFVQLRPSDAGGHYLLGKFYLTQGALEPARTSLEKAIALKPQYPQALSLLANICVKLRANQRAIDLLERSLALRPNSAVDLLQYAVLKTDSAPEVARKSYAQAVALSPNDALFAREYARFLQKFGPPETALSQAQRAVALAPSDATAQLLLGQSLVQSGKLADAILPLERAASGDPDDPRAAQELVRLYQKLNNTAKTALWTDEHTQRLAREREWRDANTDAQNHPESSAARRKLAALYARKGEVNGCVRELAAALHSAPDNPNVLGEAAALLNAAKRYTLALPVARQARNQAPSSPKIRETLGNALLGLGWLHQAAIEFDAAANASPSLRPTFKARLITAETRVQTAPSPAEQLYQDALDALETSNDRGTKALSILQKVIAIEPTHCGALHLITELHLRRKEFTEVEGAARQVLALWPEDSAANTYLALALLEQKTESSADAAESLLDQAAPDPQLGAPYFYARGLTQLRKGDAKSAVASLKRSLEFDPRAVLVYRSLVVAAQQAGDRTSEQTAQRELDRLGAVREKDLK